MKFEFKEHTDKGLVREVNEDKLGHSLDTRNGDIFVVCDGMGGHVGGKTASTIGVNAIMGELSQKEHSNMHVAISQSLVFANEQVLGHAAADPSLKGMGSTATVCLIKDDLLYVGHVGDSRAYIFSDGKLYRITRDDSFVQQLVDRGSITEDEAESHPQKNRILQALGSTSALSPRIPNKPFKLKKGDLLMLCSDGLTSMVVDELIEKLINPDNLEGTLNDLHRYAMNNGGKDNITITLIKVTSSIHAHSEFDHYTKKYPKVDGGGKGPGPEPIKKKQPLALIIGAAAAVVLIVVGIIFWNNSSNESAQDAVKGSPSQKNPNLKNDTIDKTYESDGTNSDQAPATKDSITKAKPQNSDSETKVDRLKKDILKLKLCIDSLNVIKNDRVIERNGAEDGKKEGIQREIDALVEKIRQKEGDKKSKEQKLDALRIK
jgi:serine/threonine protein phosphatase PrpC